MEPNVRMKELLFELEQQKTDLQGFLLKCALWTVETLDSVSFKPLPMKPKEVQDYEALPQEDRVNLSTEYFDAYPAIRMHYDLCRKIRAENLAHYDWLQQVRKIIALSETEGKQEKVNRIDEKTSELAIEQLW